MYRLNVEAYHKLLKRLSPIYRDRPCMACGETSPRQPSNALYEIKEYGVQKGGIVAAVITCETCGHVSFFKYRETGTDERPFGT